MNLITKNFMRRVLIQCLFLITATSFAFANGDGEDESCLNGFVSYKTTVCGTGTSTITVLGSNSVFKLWANPSTTWGETVLAQESTNGSGTAYITTPSVSTNTTFYISRVHNNGSGCESSRMPVSITVRETPTVFSYTGGGTYCSDGPAYVTLSKSETGVVYSLYKGNSGSPVSSLNGTGDGTSSNPGPLQFAVTEAHSDYQIKAKRTGCTEVVSMYRYSNVNIAFVDPPAPLTVEVDGGTTSFCGPISATIRLKNAVSGYRYELFQNNGSGPSEGTQDGAGFDRTWNVTAATTYKIKGWRIDGGCTQVVDMANTVELTSIDQPTNRSITNSNPGTLCAGETARLSVDSPEPNTQYKLYYNNGGEVPNNLFTQPAGSTTWDFQYIAGTNGYSTTGGHFIVKAKADGCTEWVTVTGTNVYSVIYAQQPTAKDFSGGGSFCNTGAGSGSTIAVQSPQASVWYHLFKEIGTNNWVHQSSLRTLDGYGDISWLVGSGKYDVQASANEDPDDGCLVPMNPNNYSDVTSISPPTPKTIGGDEDYCWDQIAQITLSSPESGVNYQIFHSNGNPVAAHPGTKSLADGNPIVWQFTFTDANDDGISDNNDTYIVKGTRDGCATINMSNSRKVTFNRRPKVYNFNGGGEYCDTGTSSGATITLEDSDTGIYYHLYGPSGYINSQQGTNSAISWSGASVRALGAYSIKAGNTATPDGCLRNMTASGFVNVTKVVAPTNRDVSISNTGGALCFDETIRLTVSSPEPGTYYRLFYQNGDPVSGQTNEKTGSNAYWDFSFVDDGSGTGRSATNGHYIIRARRNGCPDWVTMNAGASITVHFDDQPPVTTFSGGGEFCTTDGGAQIQVDDPDANIWYHLFIKHGTNSYDYVDKGMTTTGFGDVEWTVTTNGEYEVFASEQENLAVEGSPFHTDNCLKPMTKGSFTDVETVSVPIDRPVTGSGFYCPGQNVRVEVTSSEPDVSYELFRPGPGATLISVSSQNGNGGIIYWNVTMIDADNDGIADNNGEHVVKATRTPCATIPLTDRANIVFDREPTIYTFEGGGEYCDNDATSGAEIRLLESQTGIWYHLYSPSGSRISTKAGTDNEGITWNGADVREVGAYTIRATATETYVEGTTCYASMSRSTTNWNDVQKTVGPDASKTVSVTNNGDLCWNEIATISVASPETDVTYKLYKDGSHMAEMPNRSGFGGTVSWDLNITVHGDAEYSVYGFRNGCTEQLIDEAVSVSFKTEPNQFEVSGGGAYCEDGTATISLSDSDLNMPYEIRVNGAIERTWTGTGEAEDFTITQPGNYTIVALVPGCDEVPMTNNTSEEVREVVLSAPQVTSYYGCSGDLFNLEVLDYDVYNSDIQTYHWYLAADSQSPTAYGPTFDIHLNGSGAGMVFVAAVSPSGCEGPWATIWTHLTPKPKDPVVYNQTRCGEGTVFLGLASIEPETTYVWYTGGEEVGRGPQFETPVLTASKGYTVIAYANGCESDPVTVTAIVNNVAQPPTPVIENDCAKQYLRAQGDVPVGLEWYWQGTNADGMDRSLSADRDFLTTEPGTYYIRAFDPALNCWSPAVSKEITVTDAPRIIPDGCNGITVPDWPAPTADYPTSDRYNYVKTFTAREPGVTVDAIEDEVSPLTKEQLSLSTTYFDGLGRTMQNVRRQASPEGYDMVLPTEYDEFGRQTRQYLGYTSASGSGEFKTNVFAEQDAKLRTHFGNEVVFYGITQYEENPLNRVMKKMEAGNGWAGSGIGVKSKVEVNTTEEGVRIWRTVKANASGAYIDPDTGSPLTVEMVGDELYPFPVTNHVYETGELYVDVLTDEDGNITREYRDKSGLLVLKKQQVADSPGVGHTGWANTYYVYDERDILHFIFPPNAVEKLEALSWTVTRSVFDPIIYQYTHDGRGRQTTKQLPASGREYMVYDQLDRLVASQNAMQRSGMDPHWIYTKFDQHDRPVLVGKYSGTENRIQLQSLIDGGSFSINVTSQVPSEPGTEEATNLKTDRHEEGTTTYKASESIVFLPGFDSGESSFDATIDDQLSINNKEGYNDNTFPADGDNIDVYEVMYYDDYRFTTKTFDDTFPAFTASETSMDPVLHENTSGLKTGGKVRVLGTDQFLEQIFYYDNRDRIIQKRLENKNGGENTETRQFSFDGSLLQNYIRHTNPVADIPETRLLKQYTYDHQDRRLSASHEVNDSGETKPLGVYTYDELGALDTRVLGNELETLNYDYNIRGWLSSINGDELKSHTQMKDHLFGLELSYNHGFTKVNQRGNISGVKWKTMSDPVMRAFGYDYDRLNRVTKADFSEGLNWGIEEADFSIGGITYDLDGNIQTLERQGVVGGMKTQIDNLSFEYQTASPNMLRKVVDNSSESQGFNDLNDNEVDYVYDAQGNLASDGNKHVASIIYNYLGQTTGVIMEPNPEVPGDFALMTNTYDAQGNKLAETSNEGGEESVIDYMSGFIYEDNQLKMFGHDEGRVRQTRNGLVHDYYLKDHLGNNRLTLTDESPSYTYLATMESDYDEIDEVDLKWYEESLFMNLIESRVVYENANYTVNLNFEPNEVARLNGSDDLTRVGPAKLLEVLPGDFIEMEAFAYYEGSLTAPSIGLSPSVIATAVGTAFGGSATGTFEQQNTMNLFTNSPLAVAVGDVGVDDSQPRAYLNYVLFDANLDMVDAGFIQVSEEAMGNHEKLELKKTVTEHGYIYIYLSNETDADFPVYFDDFRIKSTESLVVQEAHYYPFGMNIQALGYGKNQLEGIANADKLSLGWTDLGFRNFDSRIARFYGTDPMAEMTVDFSNFNYAANNPIKNIDLLGLTPGYHGGSNFRDQSLRLSLMELNMNPPNGESSEDTEFFRILFAESGNKNVRSPKSRSGSKKLSSGARIVLKGARSRLNKVSSFHKLGESIHEEFGRQSEKNSAAKLTDFNPNSNTTSSSIQQTNAGQPSVSVSGPLERRFRSNKHIPPSIAGLTFDYDALSYSMDRAKISQIEVTEDEYSRTPWATPADRKWRMELALSYQKLTSPTITMGPYNKHEVPEWFEEATAGDCENGNIWCEIRQMFEDPEAYFRNLYINEGWPPFQAGVLAGLVESIVALYDVAKMLAIYSAPTGSWIYCRITAWLLGMTCSELQEAQKDVQLMVDSLIELLSNPASLFQFLRNQWDEMLIHVGRTLGNSMLGDEHAIFDLGKGYFNFMAAFLGIITPSGEIKVIDSVADTLGKFKKVGTGLRQLSRAFWDRLGRLRIKNVIGNRVDAVLDKDGIEVLELTEEVIDNKKTWTSKLTDPDLKSRVPEGLQQDLADDMADYPDLFEAITEDRTKADDWVELKNIGVEGDAIGNSLSIDIHRNVDYTTFDPSNLSKAQKTYRQLLKNVAKSEAGQEFGEKIVQGDFKDAQGYTDLVKKAGGGEDVVKSLNQTIDKATELHSSGVSKADIRFEHDLNSGVHDVDVGVKRPGTTDGYLEAYQVKTLDGKLRSDKIQKAATQLKTVDADRKIVEFKLKPGSTTADVDDPRLISEMEFQSGVTDPTKGSGIHEFRFILDDGATVVYQRVGDDLVRN